MHEETRKALGSRNILYSTNGKYGNANVFVKDSRSFL